MLSLCVALKLTVPVVLSTGDNWSRFKVYLQNRRLTPVIILGRSQNKNMYTTRFILKNLIILFLQGHIKLNKIDIKDTFTLLQEIFHFR